MDVRPIDSHPFAQPAVVALRHVAKVDSVALTPVQLVRHQCRCGPVHIEVEAVVAEKESRIGVRAPAVRADFCRSKGLQIVSEIERTKGLETLSMGRGGAQEQ